jgi:hypothetical protein
LLPGIAFGIVEHLRPLLGILEPVLHAVLAVMAGMVIAVLRGRFATAAEEQCE